MVNRVGQDGQGIPDSPVTLLPLLVRLDGQGILDTQVNLDTQVIQDILGGPVLDYLPQGQLDICLSLQHQML